jgi:hypothetical protein
MCLLLFGFYNINAQVTIIPQIPSVGLIAKSQIWNLGIINTSNEDLNVSIQVVVTEKGSNSVIFKANSREFVARKGANQFRQDNLMPIIYTNLNPQYPVNTSPYGFLPVGIFDICYYVSGNSLSTSEFVVTDCDQLVVEPLSPPQLITPGYNDSIYEVRPTFIWIAPTPSSAFSRLIYDFTLVEVLTNQSAGDAIQTNIPILYQSGHASNQLVYPFTLPSLQVGKTYAWRISAMNNLINISNSETWQFTVKSDVSDSFKLPVPVYTSVKKYLDAQVVSVGDSLRFSFDNEWNDKELVYSIFDITDGVKTVVYTSSELDLKFGSNLFSMNISNIFKRGRIYLLEIFNSKKEQHSLKFKRI